MTSPKDQHQLGLSTLYVPPSGATVVADIIFIHGLEGGSIKSWSRSSGQDTVCWPRDLLPAEPRFKQARLHTFGYNANWKHQAPAVLSVDDFAKSLLKEMKNHHQIREGRNGIIFVCHGLGGCIAKGAYILARQDPSCNGISARIHAMIFLATPHGGSGLEKALKELLLLAGVEEKGAEKLAHDSRHIRQVNETFSQFAPDFKHLYTYYESMSMPHHGNKFVVGRECAILGLENEEVSYLDADFNEVCKYSGTSDGNYRRVRNALDVAIERFFKD